MKSRPFYRWKSLWLGVVVLLFLGWAWQQSRQRNQMVSVATPVGAFGISQVEGQASFFAANLKQNWGVSKVSVPRRMAAVWFPTMVKMGLSDVSGAGYHRRDFHLRFAHWFLILVFVTVWSAWLAWKWKRERRKIA